MSVALFIDSNQYIKLFGLTDGQKLLAMLEEQRDHIFICKQISDEVMRSKLESAKFFFDEMIKDVEELRTSIPDHLLGISKEEVGRFRTTFSEVKAARAKLEKIIEGTLHQISASNDEVSTRLQRLFDTASLPNRDELARARERREIGNPPGKADDPLGDQVIWEQFLSYCKSREVKRVWFVSEDKDYCTSKNKKSLLNPFLYRELNQICGPNFELNGFTNLLTGITHFTKNAGVKSIKTLSKHETEEIRQEIERLPDLESRMLRKVFARLVALAAQPEVNAARAAGNATIELSSSAGGDKPKIPE